MLGTLVVQLLDSSTQAKMTVNTDPAFNLTGLVGGWHHLAFTYDGRGGPNAGDGITIYLDGVALPVWRETSPAYVAMENLASAVQIGRESAGNQHYVGGLDELRLWQGARTQAQILSTMSAELSGNEAGLRAYWRFNEGTGTTVADDSTNDFPATLVNGTLWAAGGPLAPDTTAPQISNIVVSNLSSSGATITFTTNEPAIGSISYVAGTACPCTEVFSSGSGTAHTVILTGLTPTTSYQYTVRARDGANNLQVSTATSFQTLAVAMDVQPPTVAFVAPAAGPVGGTVTLEATASDAVGVTSVAFFVNGVALGVPDTTAPYTLPWNTATVADGPYTIVAEARDAANNVGTTSRSVTVQNGAVTPSAPHHVSFDGVNDAATVADAPALSFGTGTADTPFTMEMWVRPGSVLQRHQLIAKTGEYRIGIMLGTLAVQLLDSSTQAKMTVNTDPAFNLTGLVGGWHHLAFTYDGRGGPNAGDGITIYLDGVALPVWRETSPAYVAMENLASAVQIGRESAGNQHYVGGLDELRLWQGARTQAQILSTMSAELSGNEAGLRAYWRFNEGTGTTVADDSTNDFPATLVNGTLWAAGGPLAPDTTAPQISNIVVSNLSSSGATITFTTNEPAIGSISYVAGTACPCTEVFSSGSGTAHTVILTGLTPTTSYQYTVRARDGANNLQVSTATSFQTLAVAMDVQPPTVAFVAPAAGPVGGTVTLEATASDAVGVTSVAFFVNGVALGVPDTTAPYTLPWNTATVADGPYTIVAEARDAANNVGTTSRSVTVQNGAVTPSAPHHVSFDGVNDAATVADAPALSFGTGTADTPFTMEMWVRPGSVLQRHQLIAKTGEYRIGIMLGTLAVQLLDSSTQAKMTVNTDPAFNLTGLVGGWHHLAFTYDGRGGPNAGDGITIYLDGVALPVWRETSPAYVAMENLASAVQIGRESAGNQHYVGGLDELRLWQGARTQAQILSTMSAELSGNEAGLRAYWRFNEGTGTTVADGSPNTSPATLVNGTLWAAGGPF